MAVRGFQGNIFALLNDDASDDTVPQVPVKEEKPKAAAPAKKEAAPAKKDAAPAPKAAPAKKDAAPAKKDGPKDEKPKSARPEGERTRRPTSGKPAGAEGAVAEGDEAKQGRNRENFLRDRPRRVRTNDGELPADRTLDRRGAPRRSGPRQPKKHGAGAHNWGRKDEAEAPAEGAAEEKPVTEEAAPATEAAATEAAPAAAAAPAEPEEEEDKSITLADLKKQRDQKAAELAALLGKPVPATSAAAPAAALASAAPDRRLKSGSVDVSQVIRIEDRRPQRGPGAGPSARGPRTPTVAPNVADEKSFPSLGASLSRK